MRHAFHPEAAAEFEEAVRFYKERGRNLGKRLAREVKTTIRKIVATPDRWRVLEEDVRRCLVRVFPYSVLYTIEADHRRCARETAAGVLAASVVVSPGALTRARETVDLSRRSAAKAEALGFSLDAGHPAEAGGW